jgi:hypothetical protein
VSVPVLVLADNCGSLSDCFSTLAAALAVIAAVAVVAALIILALPFLGPGLAIGAGGAAVLGGATAISASAAVLVEIAVASATAAAVAQLLAMATAAGGGGGGGSSGGGSTGGGSSGGGSGAPRPLGNNLHNVRTVNTGRLRGFTRGDSELGGGLARAREVFRQLTGRDPSGTFDRVVVNGREVVFRELGGSGHPKVEIIDHAARFFEKITFVP